MLTVNLLPLALSDLDRIYDYYAVSRGVPVSADKIIDSIYETIFYDLASHPFMGRPVASKEPEMRMFLSGRIHWIFYSSDKETLDVYRIAAAKEITTFDYFA